MDNRKFYSMEMKNDKKCDITMYGDIVEEIPTDWFTGEKIEGNYIVESEFLADLEKMEKAEEITLHMNSCGGNAAVSILIHNKLRELAAKGKKLCCVVDGAAMSGGSLIMSACDNVRVNPSSLIMIHKCWSTVFGGYNADELRAMADQNDVFDKAQASIYKRKCGLSETQIMHMMAETTYMTGSEAVEKGFADELLDSEAAPKIAASADGKVIFVNGHPTRLMQGEFAPDFIPTISNERENNDSNVGLQAGEAIDNTIAPDISVSEDKEEHPMTMDEIRAEHAEEINAMQNDAIKAERQRIKEIDEIASLFDAEMVAEAKFGETACNASELALRAAKKAAAQGRQFLASLESDAEEGGADNVEAAAVPAEEVPVDEQTQAEQAIADIFAKLK